jgi:hypothetical protein
VSLIHVNTASHSLCYINLQDKNYRGTSRLRASNSSVAQNFSGSICMYLHFKRGAIKREVPLYLNVHLECLHGCLYSLLQSCLPKRSFTVCLLRCFEPSNVHIITSICQIHHDFHLPHSCNSDFYSFGS